MIQSFVGSSTQTSDQAQRIFEHRQSGRDIGGDDISCCQGFDRKTFLLEHPNTNFRLTQHSSIIGTLNNGDQFPRLLQGAGIIALYDGKL